MLVHPYSKETVQMFRDAESEAMLAENKRVFTGARMLLICAIFTRILITGR